MNRTQHTPGPWRCDFGNHDNRERPFVRANQKVPGGLNGIAVCKVCHSAIGYSEAEANARLIAAAPELLESCQALLKMVDELLPLAPKGCGWGTIETDIARERIAKAIGQ